MIECRLCGKKFRIITNTHLKSKHRYSIQNYARQFGSQGVGFIKSIALFHHSETKYTAWRRSLFRRPPPWSAGYTKETHPGVAKISRTFRRKKIDNFFVWRRRAMKSGLLRIPKPLKKDGDLAFLIGMILGDGSIYKFPRTEGLRITLGTDKPNLWRYAARMVERVFVKRPTIAKLKNSNCMIITIYENKISARLGIPAGNRARRKIIVAPWILNKKTYMVRYLRGLYEAEGSHCIHLPTSTYKLFFSNRNKWMIRNVYMLMKKLGYHPHISPKNFSVQLSRKDEVIKAIDQLEFRKY